MAESARHRRHEEERQTRRDPAEIKAALRRVNERLDKKREIEKRRVNERWEEKLVEKRERKTRELNERPRLRGTVKWFDFKKGYGFIIR